MKRFSSLRIGGAIFQAFAYRNFRWFFVGQVLSMTGHWIQQIALGWIIYEMTGSAFLLGAIGAIALFPGFFLVPVAGSLADIFDRRVILVLTQALTAIQSILLAVLLWLGVAQVWHLFLLAFGIGMLHGIDIAVRQSIVAYLVDRRALTNAIALHSITFNLARLAGPSAAGLLLAMGYAAHCFTFHALACAIGALTFVMIRTPPPAKREAKFRLFQEMREGLAYSWGTMPIRNGILLLAVAGFFVFPYTALMPMFSTEVLGGDALTFGSLSAAPAVGAIAGGLYLAARGRQRKFESLIFAAGIAAACLLILFSSSRSIILAGFLLTLLGAAILLWTASINTHLQLTVDDAKRGRVMGFFTMAFMGAAPAGFLVYGFAASLIGPAWTLCAGGFSALTCVLILRGMRN